MATINSGNSTTLYSTTQTTTSVSTATNLPAPQVNETNFTTLYSNSSAAATGGGTSGNLLVSGNLRVLGTSDLEGAVTIGNSYILPTSDGTNGQVVVTDGSGNLTFQSVSSISSYAIQADTATGGANLTLVGLSTTDSVKFASGTNITVSYTDANTITISTVADTIPDGTAKGQVLYWDGSAWTANSTITFDATADRLRVVNNVSGDITAFDILKQYSGTLADGSAVAELYGFYDGGALSTTNPRYTHRIRSEYDTAGNPIYRVQIDPTNNFNSGSTTIVAQLTLDNDILAITGNAFVVNKDVTGAPTEDGIFAVNRGTSTDATMTWNETDDRWDFTDNVLAAGWLGAQADIIYINWDDTAIDSYLSFKGINSEYIKWNNTDTRFEFSDQIYNSQTDIPAIFERRSLTADINTPLEFKSGLRLTQRVTDAPDNDTLAAGPGITFTRTSGATATTERVFASMGAVWDGATQTVDWGFNWSNDDFAEPTPGNFPGTYRLLRLGSNDSEFYNNSIYIDYSAQGTTRTATSIITSNTLVFGSAHSYTAGDRIIYTSTTQNGLTQNSYYYVLAAGLTATQCQLGLTENGSAITLTNGTGLTLVFADLINQVGINTDTPAYTLDVNGDANVSGDITISGVKVDLTTPVHQGQFLYVSNDVTPTITNSSVIIADVDTYRPVFQYDNSTAGSNGAMFVRKNYGATAFTTDDGVHIGYQIDSDSQARQQIASIGAVYQGVGISPKIFLSTNSNANTTGPFVEVAIFDTTDASICGTTLTLNSEATGAAVDTYFAVNRGSTGADVNIKWNAGTNRWQTTVDGTTYLNIPNQNLDTTDNVLFNSVTIDSQATLDSSTLTTTSTATVELMITARNAMTGLINIIQGTNAHCLNFTVLRTSASTAMLTTYAEMYDNISLGSFTADVSAGDLRLLVTPSSATSTVFSVVRTSLT